MQIRVSGREPAARSNLVGQALLRLADGLKSLAAGASDPGLSRIAVMVGSAKAIGVIAIVTAGLLVLKYSVNLRQFEHLSLLLYLAAVVLAATRWGTLPAIIAALVSGAAQAFFFYPPDFAFGIDDPENVFNLMMFLLIAFATGKLAGAAAERTCSCARA